MPERLEFVAEKFEPHRPGTGERPDVENAAAQGDFALLRDLRFRFIALLFEPFDQVERIDFIAADQRARAVFQIIRSKSFLQKRGDAGDDDCGLWTPAFASLRRGRLDCEFPGQRDERLEAVADGVCPRAAARPTADKTAVEGRETRDEGWNRRLRLPFFSTLDYRRSTLDTFRATFRCPAENFPAF